MENTQCSKSIKFFTKREIPIYFDKKNTKKSRLKEMSVTHFGKKKHFG